MCDTIIATPAASRNALMLFGKNSDRQRNEAQAIELVPRAEHAPGASVACTYVRIPQARQTHAVIVARPFWIWGAEMGANEHGVVIGNEGLFARTPSPETPALIGMDLLRLGLERGATASEALAVITALLERHGQGGNCGHLEPSYYHNAFIIADASEAFVLDTIDRDWVVERVNDIRAVSNSYSVGENAIGASDGMNRLLRRFGWDGRDKPDYSSFLADSAMAHIGSAGPRRRRATSLLAARAGSLTAADMMRILRDHDPDGDAPPDWAPNRATVSGLCIHAGSQERFAQTTGAMVSEIGGHGAVHWVTGTAAPCLSIFKPVLFGADLPVQGTSPTDRYDPRGIWWRHEMLHRSVLAGDFPAALAIIAEERAAIEADFASRIEAIRMDDDAERASLVVAQCWADAAAAEVRWQATLPPGTGTGDSGYDDCWSRMNALAGVVIPASEVSPSARSERAS